VAVMSESPACGPGNVGKPASKAAGGQKYNGPAQAWAAVQLARIGRLVGRLGPPRKLRQPGPITEEEADMGAECWGAA